MAKVLSGSILYYTHIHHIEWDRIQLAKSLSFVRKSHFMTGGMRHSAPHNGKNVQYQMLFTLENGLPADESLTFFLLIQWYPESLLIIECRKSFLISMMLEWTPYILLGNHLFPIYKKTFVKFLWKSTVVVKTLSSICKFNLAENYEM